jgi:hypothetical protein
MAESSEMEHMTTNPRETRNQQVARGPSKRETLAPKHPTPKHPTPKPTATGAPARKTQEDLDLKVLALQLGLSISSAEDYHLAKIENRAGGEPANDSPATDADKLYCVKRIIDAINNIEGVKDLASSSAYKNFQNKVFPERQVEIAAWEALVSSVHGQHQGTR